MGPVIIVLILFSVLITVWYCFCNNLCPTVEKAMATHSSTLAWTIPWMEGPGGLQSMGSLGVRHDWVTSLSLFTFMHWRRKWQPTPVLLLGESQGRRAWWAAIYGVAQSRTRLKRLSSSSSMSYSNSIFFIPHDLCDLSSPTRGHSCEGTESYPEDCQGIPH